MSRYSSISKLKNDNPNVGTEGIPYYKGVIYPEVGFQDSDIYLITEFGDSLDALAHQFYKDKNDYWIIAIANPNKIDLGSLMLEPGIQIRVPINTSSIKNKFNRLNE